MVNGSHFLAIASFGKSQIKPKSELKLILARPRAAAAVVCVPWQRARRYRKSVPCDDCLGPLPEHLTLAEVEERLQLGVRE
jgi:hypothetical protein